MSALHYVNAALWLANAVTWAFYAHVPAMAVASLGAAVLSIVLARGDA